MEGDRLPVASIHVNQACNQTTGVFLINLIIISVPWFHKIWLYHQSMVFIMGSLR